MPDTDMLSAHDFLIRGRDIQKHKLQDFELVGRDEQLKNLMAILMREESNSALLVGQAGVGSTALCYGLIKARDLHDAPFDLIRKRFFWLDSDGLFASGDPNDINESFRRTLKTLEQTSNSVLIIDDFRDFIDAARNNGVSNLINALMRTIKQKKTQAIFETRDDDLEVVLRTHSDMREKYTVMDVLEPQLDQLYEIIDNISGRRLEKFHEIPVSDEAINTAIDLTTKYRVRDIGLSMAQPACTISLLDRSLTAYRQNAHSLDSRIPGLEAKLRGIQLQPGTENAERAAELERIQTEIDRINEAWQQRQANLRRLYTDIRDGENNLRALEVELELLIDREDGARKLAAQQAAERGEQLPSFESFSLGNERIDSDRTHAIREKIRLYEKTINEASGRLKELTKDINDSLELQSEHVLELFSKISGIPVTKLTQDERAKLLGLEQNLGRRVFGQGTAVTKLANQVKVAKAGLQSPNKPQAAFLFLGPSGVGKTELAKALTIEIMDDEGALLRFDMSEYMEKHAVAKLIGAPPGYEGYEAGGILTNEMRRNPRRIILFDEIEKAHPDVFNVFLQILDDARLTDNRGLTVSFREAIIIMTTNIGTNHFLGESDAKVAAALALEDLDQHYRPEFLNRFNGRQNIVCFNTLDLPVIEMIAKRDLAKLDHLVKANSPGLSIAISENDIANMCADHYKPVNGARGITGYLEGVVKPEIANTVLFNTNVQGEIMIEYDAAAKKVAVQVPGEMQHSA